MRSGSVVAFGLFWTTLLIPSLPAAEAQPAPGAAKPARPVTQAAAEPKAAPDLDALLSFVPAVAARYGDKSVTAAEVRKRLLPELRGRVHMAETSGDSIPAADLQKLAKSLAFQTVSDIIDQQLLLARAAKEGFTLDPAAAKKKATQEFEAAENGLGKEKVDQNLKDQGTSRDEAIAEFAERLAEQTVVMDWVEQRIKPAHLVAESDVKSYYEQNRARFSLPEMFSVAHILVKFKNPKPTAAEKAEARGKAEAVLKKLKDGADFAALAQQYSDCPSAKDGGQLEPFTKGELVRPIEAAARRLKPGEISGVVESDFGFHIIKAGEPTPAHTKPFAEVKAELTQELQWRKLDEVLRRMAREAREAAKVEILVPEG